MEHDYDCGKDTAAPEIDSLLDELRATIRHEEEGDIEDKTNASQFLLVSIPLNRFSRQDFDDCMSALLRRYKASAPTWCTLWKVMRQSVRKGTVVHE